MSITLPEIHFRFHDFAILAVLLAALYGLSALEFILASSGDKKEKKLTDIAKARLHHAITWAFLGILITLVAGVFATLPQLSQFGIPLFLIPLVFISRWAMFHYNEASSLVKIDDVALEMDSQYKEAIRKYVTDSSKPLTAKEVYEGCAEARDFSQILHAASTAASTSLRSKTISVSMDAIFEKLIFSEKKAGELLDRLATKDRSLVKRNDGRYEVRK